jgi:hypothetical protein
MPVFDITAPDGTKYTVTGPDGSTEHDALAQVMAQHQAAPAAAAPTFGQKIKNELGGLEQSLYDIPQSAMELGARGTDAVGLTDGAYKKLCTSISKTPVSLRAIPTAESSRARRSAARLPLHAPRWPGHLCRPGKAAEAPAIADRWRTAHCKAYAGVGGSHPRQAMRLTGRTANA